MTQVALDRPSTRDAPADRTRSRTSIGLQLAGLLLLTCATLCLALAAGVVATLLQINGTGH